MTATLPPVPASPPLVSFEGVTLAYGRREVCRALTLSIRAGEFWGLVGPNGSGKTTILKAMLGLLAPRAGRITWGTPARRFGYVPQREAVDEAYPLTAGEIVLMGRYALLGVGRRPRAADHAAVREALRVCGIAELEGTLYRRLSGGQKQRVLIARALVGDPTILILDEPTNGLDLTGEAAIMTLLTDLHRAAGYTVVMVSHLLSVVANAATRLGLLRDATLDVGDVEAMLTPAHLGAMYGQPVHVETVRGRRVIFGADRDRV